MSRAPWRARLRVADVVQGAAASLRARSLRAVLSALGVAIGIGSGVAILGISASSQADLLAQLGADGNVLTVSAGTAFDGSAEPLPTTAEGMIGLIPPVQSVTSVGSIPGVTVRRTAAVPEIDTGGISVLAVQASLLKTLGGSVARGTFLNSATGHYPAVVLGAVAAQSLGIDRVPAGTEVDLGGRYFSVVGILRPIPLAPAIDQSAMVGFPVANSLLGLGGHPTEIYLRVDPDQVQAVANVLSFTANPSQPGTVQVSRPSSILAARLTAKTAFTGLFLGLGAVAVLVGGVGIANIMVISVLERRREIGLRRALGATRKHVGAQFFVESLLLSALGGVAGVLLGALATVSYAAVAGQPTVMPAIAVMGGVGVAMTVGVLAGIHPATRASRLAPADAFRAT